MQSNINSVHLNMHIDAASTWDPLFGAFAMQLNRFDGRRIRLAERKEKHSHSFASLWMAFLCYGTYVAAAI